MVERGEGPALLLIHGFLVSHKEWLSVLPALSERFRVIAPDLPGAGASEKISPERYPYTLDSFASTLFEVLDVLEVPQAHVVGHSMGGGIAITLAADRPERVDRLVLCDSASYAFRLPWKGKLPFLPGIGPLLMKHLYGRAMMRDYFRNDVWSGHAGVDLARVDEYFSDFDPTEAREAGYATLMRSLADVSPLASKIRAIRAPTLVIWGDEDRLFPTALGERLARDIPKATLRIVPHSGHAPNEEHPNLFASWVREHLLGEP